MPGLKSVLFPLVFTTLSLVLSACLFGGGDAQPSAPRPGSIPTATPPAEPPEPILLGETQSTAGGQATAPPGQTTYTVRSGDTLSGIAANFGIPATEQAAWIAEVMRLNAIPDARALRSGQELVVPAPSPTPRAAATPGATGTPNPTATPAAAAQASPTPAASPTPRPTVIGGGGTYTVVSGDFPLLIAQKLGVPDAQANAWAQQLMDLNDTCASCLQVGQVLQLPAGTPQQTPVPATPTPTPAATATPSP
jgi:LysM repeat protein